MRVVDSYQAHVVVHKGNHYMYDTDGWWSVDHTIMEMVQDDVLEAELDKAWKVDWEKDIMDMLRKGEQMKDALDGLENMYEK